MSNIFEDVLKDVGAVEKELLGPNYEYWKQINSPSEMGMSGNGDLQTLANDIGGLVNYVELLVTGQGTASKTGGPLGNKFFLKTGGKCNSNPSGDAILQDRFIYINHVPDGNIPFVSSAMGTNFTEFEGLIPGTMSNLNTLNPFGIMQAFMAGTNPPCQEITLQTIDHDNNSGTQTQYVTTVDIKNQNLVSLQQGFANINESDDGTMISLPDDIIMQGYLACLGVVGLYVLYYLMIKRMK